MIASRGEKQIFGPQPRAEGKGLAEDTVTRWQMDLADMKNQKVEHKKTAGATYSAHRLLLVPDLGEAAEAEDAGGGEDEAVSEPKGEPRETQRHFQR